ncbi:hypothetical protein KIW84_062515 [Lathyrus oleraceus]|uniref:Reverse transcriptase domain-containing protein n=1 Tax=Pisum sativum TaxID=3888 RepID=A0A9D4W7T2_PEA|nr:hypothetical protein KIW84_062515 [Pisum sativum]
MNCKEDALSNVLVDIGSSLNVLPKSTLSRLSYQDAPMRYSGVIVKAFDGSRKTVIGEVNLPVKIGLSDFKITFQVMDIHPTYSCFLGRPWIHEAGAVTSILHQKLKFVKNGKLVIVGGEKALLVSHLSSFSYVEAEEEVGIPFQALSIAEVKKTGTPMSSFKDAQRAIEAGNIDQWGRMVEVAENKNIAELGFQQGPSNAKAEEVQPSDEDEDCANFVTHDKTCNNWVAVDVPVIVHRSKLVTKPIEYNDPTPSPNFDFPIFEAEEETEEEVSDELSRLLEHEEKTIQPFKEQIELVNLGSKDDVKSRLGLNYMPGLDSEIVEHRLPLKPECPPVKHKLRRTHPDMVVKIKEEVQKHIDVGFLVTAEYPQWVANIVPFPKKDGKVRMCVDYRDLNKASPKDDLPLPHIDMLVDNKAKFKVFLLMDGFSGYNQIKMAPEDMEKTTFITP